MTSNLSIPAAPASERSSLPLPSVAELKARLPLGPTLSRRVATQRATLRRIIEGRDSRLMVVVGPCSIHDDRAALDYAERLADLASRVDDQLVLVMRAYVEKPRTTVGWKGLLYDPHLDGSDDMATGLHFSRSLMREILHLGLPVSTELLHPMAAGYFSDLLAWAAIGARTTESQIHRELVSGLALPVGFKNATDGGIGVACDAIRAASHPHRHFGIDCDGHPAMLTSEGNPDTHLVLRGGRNGPNYDAQSVNDARMALERAGLPARIMVDCSHANSGKDPLRQPAVLAEVIAQRLAGEDSLRAVMLESHLESGAQSLGAPLRYGVSITDGCLGWDATEAALLEAAERLRGGRLAAKAESLMLS
ncbi:3-deoxy-7-phosphoheptulonate synthase [Halotalea alkalilenta]|uniref:Phospho-2-dehydro-3-deoxyheptonate aldolase n=1 Tax=Halotalea alkalilenta TaxID=376489 RepID=A0A172YCK0_9GAMM|nr:3-deoxy-7-phosphoheptulonate synthase [Halotalea alkalilenta]ANF56953.1 phospho-2-dehydro-3-deoxyheptonate aldolase [Halotalea alkalilenta]